MMLTSCTETIYDEVIKLDTIYLSRPSLATIITERDTIHSVDTVKVEVVIHETDTLIQVVTKDSIIIREVEKLVTVYDTITQIINQIDTVFIYVTDTVEIQVVQIEQRVIYLDTLYVLVESRQVFYVPDELMPYVSDFYTLAGQYGSGALGGMLLITYAKEEDLPGESWTSYSFRHGWDYSQMIIQISENVPSEQARSCIFRELARLQLKRKYVTDVNKIMCPLFDISRTITQTDLDALFNPLPI
jgi:hypothetical protein